MKFTNVMKCVIVSFLSIIKCFKSDRIKVTGEKVMKEVEIKIYTNV